MSPLGQFPKVAFPLLALALTFFATCDSGGGMGGDDNRAPNAELTVNTTEAVVGDTIELNASGSSDPDGDNLDFSWSAQTPEGSDVSLANKSGDTVTFVADVSGDYTPNVEVSDGTLSDSDEVAVTALEKLPETVTVSFENRAADGDSLVAHPIAWEDSVVVEEPTGSGTATIPASRNSGQLCAQESDLFNEGCISLTPTADITETQTIEVGRKTVKISVSLDLPYGSPDETSVTIYEPFRADSTEFTGENTVELAKRKQGLSRQIVADLVTDDPDRDGRLDRLAGETSVSANTDAEATAVLKALAACDDGISNETGDFEDGLVDVWEDTNGNGAPDPEDKGDPGCPGPEDDNEGHFILTLSSAGSDPDEDIYVSSAENNRKVLLTVNSDLDESVRDAINQAVLVSRDSKRQSGQTQEAYALMFDIGPGVVEKTTYISPDKDTIDGWNKDKFVIEAYWFKNELTFDAYGVHASKVQGQPPGDGNDDVIFLEKNDEELRSTVLSWAVEEEDFDGFKGSARKGSAYQEDGQDCISSQIKDFCESAKSDGYPYW